MLYETSKMVPVPNGSQWLALTCKAKILFLLITFSCLGCGKATVITFPSEAEKDEPPSTPTVEKDRASFDSKVDRAMKQLLQHSSAKQIYNDALREQAVNSIDIQERSDLTFDAMWDAPSARILLRPGLSDQKVLSAMLFELIRMAHGHMGAAIEIRAEHGDLGRAEYAIEQEKHSLFCAQLHHKIVKEAIDLKLWPGSVDCYWNIDTLSVEENWAEVDTPLKGQGIDDTHAGFFRRQWDSCYKEIYEGRQRSK